MTTKVKRLFAIYTDAYGKYHRLKIAEGSTGDFAFPKGFVVEDSEREQSEPNDKGLASGGSRSLGLNGQYPMIQSDDISYLEGKLLTLCDATFTNKEQREAFKNMVSNTLWSEYHGHVDRMAAEFSLSE